MLEMDVHLTKDGHVRFSLSKFFAELAGIGCCMS